MAIPKLEAPVPHATSLADMLQGSVPGVPGAMIRFQTNQDSPLMSLFCVPRTSKVEWLNYIGVISIKRARDFLKDDQLWILYMYSLLSFFLSKLGPCIFFIFKTKGTIFPVCGGVFNMCGENQLFFLRHNCEQTLKQTHAPALHVDTCIQ